MAGTITREVLREVRFAESASAGGARTQRHTSLAPLDPPSPDASIEPPVEGIRWGRGGAQFCLQYPPLVLADSFTEAGRAVQDAIAAIDGTAQRMRVSERILGRDQSMEKTRARGRGESRSSRSRAKRVGRVARRRFQ